MKVGTLITILLLLTAGCREVPDASVSKKSEFSEYETMMYLDPDTVQQDRLEKFMDDSSKISEASKINYLLSTIRLSKTQFIRNGNLYDGSNAAKWLRWKMGHAQYRDDPILTARDFVDRVAIRSNATGEPYELLLPNGQREEVHEILSNELDALERAIATASSAISNSPDLGSGPRPQSGKLQKDLIAASVN